MLALERAPRSQLNGVDNNTSFTPDLASFFRSKRLPQKQRTLSSDLRRRRPNWRLKLGSVWWMPLSIAFLKSWLFHQQELVDRLDEEMENNSNVASAKRKIETEFEQLKESLEEVQQQLQLVEQEKSQKEKDIATMDAELEKVNDALAKANKEKTSLGDRLQVSRSNDICMPG